MMRHAVRIYQVDPPAGSVCRWCAQPMRAPWAAAGRWYCSPQHAAFATQRDRIMDRWRLREAAARSLL